MLNEISLGTEQPVAGSGTVVVRVTVAEGATVSFKLQDADGAVSATETVHDGGAADGAPLGGVIETTLDLGQLFDSPPASGTAHIYAGRGEGFSIPQQGYDAKRQLAVDADPPTATLESGATAQAGGQVTVGYSVTDVPEKVRSITLRVVDPDGNVVTELADLQAGQGAEAQFVVPAGLDAGSYDLALDAVDEVGHRARDLLEDGLVVEPGSGGTEPPATVDALEIVSEQPVAGSDAVTVTVTAGDTVSFKVRDAAGTISATKTVADGGPEDMAPTTGVVDTTLDLGSLFEFGPASGTATVFAGEGTGFSIPEGTFDDKRQLAVDADPPTATLEDGATVKPGQRAAVTYSVSDVPQKVSSSTLSIVGPEGAVYTSISGLQVGTKRTAEFTVPSALEPGKYDLRLVAVDEVGHRATDTLPEGLVVEPKGGASVPVSDLVVVDDPPVAGSGTVTVRVNAAGPVSFKLEDSAGTRSVTRTVTDGGPADGSATDGVVETTLDLATLFESGPESGTAVVYAGGGEELSIPDQTFDVKRQLAVDADPPTAAIEGGATAHAGQQVTVPYSVTDVPEKVRSAVLAVVGPDGLVYDRITGLQAGTNNDAQFIVPGYVPAGEYDLELVVVDEVGHRASDTLAGGLVVEPASGGGEDPNPPTVRELNVVTEQPVTGTGELLVRASLSHVGPDVSFAVQDAAGTVSATTTVTDGGTGDGAADRAAVVQTSLDLGSLFDAPPASGTALVYAAAGDGFSIPDQSFDMKRQVAVDADAPTAEVTSGGSAPPGHQVTVGYSAADVPQKVQEITLQVLDADGGILASREGLQGGTGRVAQLVVPWDLSPGDYDLRLLVVDEVGHRTTDTMVDGLTVTERA